MTASCVRTTISLMAILVGVLCVGSNVQAMEGKMAQASLKGIRGVSVVVGPIKAEIESMGLTSRLIKATVQSKLRQAGISELTPEECLKTAGNPNLFVGVATRSLKGTPWYYYTINVALIQDVYLAKDQNAGKFPGKTWTTEYYGATTDLDAIQQRVEEQIDKFIDAYRRAN